MTEFRIPRGALRIDRRAGAGDERRRRPIRGCRTRRGRSPSRSRRASPRAGGADAQREARRARARGRGVPRRDAAASSSRTDVMRFIIMHKTNAHWEVGRDPGPEPDCACGNAARRAGEGGVLVSARRTPRQLGGRAAPVRGGHAHHHPGPFDRGQRAAGRLQHPARAVARGGDRVGDAPGRCWATWRSTSARSPNPGTSAWCRDRRTWTTRRYMVLRKATAATETGDAPSAAQRAELARLIDETTRSGVHLATETMRPSREGPALQEFPRRRQRAMTARSPKPRS